jgi:hypothetical protein
MMRRYRLVLLVLIAVSGTATGCATLAALVNRSSSTEQLWSEGHAALVRNAFEEAENAFTQLVAEHPNTVEGREALFYLGILRLDPRNPAWSSRIAEDRLTEYLALADRGVRLYRYPEAQAFFQMAHELNLPPDARIAVLQPQERIITIEERVLVPAEESRQLTAQIERLRTQVAERDSTIRAQQEELERIRRTLTGPGRN